MIWPVLSLETPLGPSSHSATVSDSTLAWQSNERHRLHIRSRSRPSLRRHPPSKAAITDDVSCVRALILTRLPGVQKLALVFVFGAECQQTSPLSRAYRYLMRPKPRQKALNGFPESGELRAPGQETPSANLGRETATPASEFLSHYASRSQMP